VGRDQVVVRRFLLFRQACFRSPAPRSAFKGMTVVQEAVQHGGDLRTIPQQLAPVLHRLVVSIVPARSCRCITTSSISLALAARPETRWQFIFLLNIKSKLSSVF
jgi:hypothetical protein